MINRLPLKNLFFIIAVVTSLSVAAKEDTYSRVKQLLEMSAAYRYTDMDKAIVEVNKALELSTAIGYKEGMADACLKKGQYLFNQGKHEESNVYLYKAAGLFKQFNENKYALSLKELADNYRIIGNNSKAEELVNQAATLAKNANNKLLEAECEISKGLILMNLGKFAPATTHYLNAYKIGEDIKDDEIIINSCRELGNINSLDGNINLSNQYFQKCLDLNKKTDNKLGMADAYCNLGSNFLNIGNYEEAEKSIHASIKIAEELNYRTTLALNFLNLGYLKSNTNNIPAAFENLEKALKIFQDVNDKKGQAQVYNAKGYLFAKKKEYQQAAQFYQLSEAISKEIKANDELRSSYEGLAYVFEQLNDFESAFKFQKLEQNLSKQIYSTDNAKKITQLQLNYEFNKIQENQRLAQKFKDDAAAQEKKASNIFIGFLIIAGLMSLALLYTSVRAYKENKKAKELLAERNKLITIEKERSEKLLHDIVPAELGTRISQANIQQSDNFATVMFVDFKDFTKSEEQFSPVDLMDELDIIFKSLDDISKKFKLETMKTLGDGYLCIGGLASNKNTSPIDVIDAAIKIQEGISLLKERRIKENKPYFEMQIGIHSGQIVGGIVGVRTLSDDVWGDTVQSASMIEKYEGKCEGNIKISQSTFNLVKAHFECTQCGEMRILGGNELAVYQVVSKRKEPLGSLSITENISEMLAKIES